MIRNCIIWPCDSMCLTFSCWLFVIWLMPPIDCCNVDVAICNFSLILDIFSVVSLSCIFLQQEETNRYFFQIWLQRDVANKAAGPDSPTRVNWQQWLPSSIQPVPALMLGWRSPHGVDKSLDCTSLQRGETEVLWQTTALFH